MQIEKIKKWVQSEAPEKMHFRSQDRSYVMFRYVVWFVLIENTNLSLSEIGSVFNKNHSTVIAAKKNHYHRLSSGLKQDIDWLRLYNKLSQSFKQHFNQKPIIFFNNNWHLNIMNIDVN